MTGAQDAVAAVALPDRDRRGLSGDWSYDDSTLMFSAGRHDDARAQLHRHEPPSRLTPTACEGGRRASPDSSRRATQTCPAGIPRRRQDDRGADRQGPDQRVRQGPRAPAVLPRPARTTSSTTQGPRVPGRPLVGFLTNRQGFCQQYATRCTRSWRARRASRPGSTSASPHGTATSPGRWTVTREQRARVAGGVLRRASAGCASSRPRARRPGPSNPTYAQPPGAAGGQGTRRRARRHPRRAQRPAGRP